MTSRRQWLTGAAALSLAGVGGPLQAESGIEQPAAPGPRAFIELFSVSNCETD